MHLAVIGLGLIGGSTCAAIRRVHPDWKITGYARSIATREAALARGLIDHAAESPEGIGAADLVLIAVPMGQFQ